MAQFFVLSLVLFSIAQAQAAKLADSKYFDYKVLFTNPSCETYEYEKPVKAVDGSYLKQKPKNTYCKQSDYEASANRSGSVQDQFIDWIKNPETKEIFFTYLSFSNKRVGQALCEAVQTRNVKVRFILDTGNLPDQPNDLTRAKELLACKPKSGLAKDKPEMELRGHVSGIGYAHNKLVIFNPQSEGKIRILFSSGNLSSGVAIHHENWHFVTTDANTYFAQTQVCLMNGMFDHGESAAAYKKYIQSCRAEIAAKPESDIQSYFVPGEGEAATQAIADELGKSMDIFVAAHRFSYSKLIQLLTSSLKIRAGVRLVTDDDTYWVGTTGVQVGANMANEYFQIEKLQRAGMDVRWMETNHGARLLHHNKFIVFDDRAVFAGAGNLTGDAFSKNFENFYMIRIPSVVKAFAKQREHLWDELATPTEKMPTKDVLP